MSDSRNLAAGFRMKRMERMGTGNQPPSIVQTLKPMRTRISRLPAVLILTATLLLSQCAPTPSKDTQPLATAVAVPSQHWVKVSSRPPTYYPRGVAADCPTDCQSGEWVDTEDAWGTRFFIPLHGLGGPSRQTLLQEAWSARSRHKIERIAAEQRAATTKWIVSNTICPLWLLAPSGSVR